MWISYNPYYDWKRRILAGRQERIIKNNANNKLRRLD